MPAKKPDPRAAIAEATDNAEIVGALKRLMNQKKKVWVNCHECGTKVGVETLDSAVQMRAVQTWITEGFGKTKEVQEAPGPGQEIQALAEFSPALRARALEELRSQLVEMEKSPPEEALPLADDDPGDEVADRSEEEQAGEPHAVVAS